jgi:hypothetical protein
MNKKNLALIGFAVVVAVSLGIVAANNPNLGKDSLLNPPSGNQLISLNGTNVTINNKLFWTLGDSNTNAQFANLGVAGGITQTNPAVLNVLSGLLVEGNAILGGTCVPTIYTTSTTVTPIAFIQVCTGIMMNSTSGVTSTISLPSVASVQAVNPFVPFAVELQWVYNSSTANLLESASSGIIFKNSTSTTAGTNSSTLVIPPGAVAFNAGQNINTSTLFIYSTIYQ